MKICRILLILLLLITLNHNLKCARFSKLSMTPQIKNDDNSCTFTNSIEKIAQESITCPDTENTAEAGPHDDECIIGRDKTGIVFADCGSTSQQLNLQQDAECKKKLFNVRYCDKDMCNTESQFQVQIGILALVAITGFIMFIVIMRLNKDQNKNKNEDEKEKNDFNIISEIKSDLEINSNKLENQNKQGIKNKNKNKNKNGDEKENKSKSEINGKSEIKSKSQEQKDELDEISNNKKRFKNSKFNLKQKFNSKSNCLFQIKRKNDQNNSKLIKLKILFRRIFNQTKINGNQIFNLNHNYENIFKEIQ